MRARIAVQRRQLAVGSEARQSLRERQHERALAIGRGQRLGRSRREPWADQQPDVAAHRVKRVIELSAHFGSCRTSGSWGPPARPPMPSSTPTASRTLRRRVDRQRLGFPRTWSRRPCEGPRPGARVIGGADAWSWRASRARTTRKAAIVSSRTVSRSGPEARRPPGRGTGDLHRSLSRRGDRCGSRRRRHGHRRRHRGHRRHWCGWSPESSIGGAGRAG